MHLWKAPGNASHSMTRTGVDVFNAAVFEDWMFASSPSTDEPIGQRRKNNNPSTNKKLTEDWSFYTNNSESEQ